METFIVLASNVTPANGDIDISRLILLWEEVEDYFGNNLVEVGLEKPVKITINATEIRARLNDIRPENCDKFLNDFFLKRKDGAPDGQAQEHPFSSRLQITLHAHMFSDKHEKKAFVYRLLEIIFLSMNVSVQGGCELMRMRIQSNESLDDDERCLSNYDLESAWHIANKDAWPRLSNLPFSKVWEWFVKHGAMSFLMANTGITKAVAILLRFSYKGEVDSTDIVQVSQVLESLILEKNEPQRRGLERKIPAILGEPPYKIKDWISQFYKLRSEIAHGHSMIFRPYSYQVDAQFESLEESYWEMVGMTSRGVAVIVAILQDMIKMGSSGYKFEEKLSVTRI